jgi:hypothetical protein
MSAPLSASGAGVAQPAAWRAGGRALLRSRRRAAAAAPPASAAAPHRALRVLAVGPGRPGGGGGGLILPGSEGFPGGGGGGGDGPPQQRPGGGFGPVASAPREGPLYQPFRPPAAYKETAMLPKQELLNRLTSALRARARGERERCCGAACTFLGEPSWRARGGAAPLRPLRTHQPRRTRHATRTAHALRIHAARRPPPARPCTHARALTPPG